MLEEEVFTPGTRLPTERVLSERLAVSRATLRKALDRLELEGAIVRKVGSGTFAGISSDAKAPLAGASPLELMDARQLLEPVLTREAALRAREDDLRKLRTCIERAEAADAFAEFEEWDMAFHDAVAHATQNAVFVALMANMRGMRSTPEWDRLKRASFGPDLHRQYQGEHLAILQALVTRDPAAAAGAMFKHLQSVRHTMAGHTLYNPAPPELPIRESTFE